MPKPSDLPRGHAPAVADPRPGYDGVMPRILLACLFVSGCAQGQEPASVPPTFADGDRDGVADEADACRDVAGVAPDGCPFRDRDGDGTADVLDACPDGPGSSSHDCDRDGDTLIDRDDKCPLAAETRNGYQDDDGCPDAPPLVKLGFPNPKLYFDAGNSSVKPKQMKLLDLAVRMFAEFPNARYLITGHTDARERSPDELSLRRAEEVRRLLIERGVPAERMDVRGAGAEDPADTNKTEKGRAINRRVEFTPLVE
jgi:OOP family OmpA-OmpF porin